MKMNPQAKPYTFLAMAALCSFLVILCSGVGYARSLGTVTEPTGTGYPHTADCNFDALTVDGSDAYYPNGYASNTMCHELVVTGCPVTTISPAGTLPPITVYVAVSTPTTIPPLGTIILHSGDGGTSFFNYPSGGSEGLGTPSYVNDYWNADYVTVQVAWDEVWWDNTNEPAVKSMMDEACRPATLLHYIYANYAYSGKPVCAQGHSTGAAALGYSMAWYGADKNSSGGYLNTVLLTAGPAQSDIQSGCAYHSGTGLAPISVCNGGVCVGGSSTSSWQSCLQYANKLADCMGNNYPHIAKYDAAQSLSAKTIGFSNPHAAENNCNNYHNNGTSTTDLNSDWANMSLISTGANFSYPHTFVFGYLCSGPDIDTSGNELSNNSSAQGWSYQSLLTPSLSQNSGFPTIYRIDNCAEPESIWVSGSVAVGTPGPLDGFHASEGDMITDCRNPH